MRKAVLVMAAVMLAATAAADDGKPPSTGLSVIADAGVLWADKVNAAFYNGRPGNANSINRILHSNQYGTQIWNDLVSSGAISPSSTGSYSQLQVVEYPPEMFYRIAYQIGVGIRYDYKSGFGWLLRFDLATLTAVGQFNLGTNDALLGSRQYVTCDIMGKEKRINIDLALTRTVALQSGFDVEVDLGGSLSNSKVQDNVMQIAGRPYSILDRWGGRTPDYGVAAYGEYINQGGIGYGVFASVLVGYSVPSVGAIKVGYTCYRSKTVLQGYTAWGWHHMLGIRLEMNNFTI